MSEFKRSNTWYDRLMERFSKSPYINDRTNFKDRLYTISRYMDYYRINESLIRDLINDKNINDKDLIDRMENIVYTEVLRKVTEYLVELNNENLDNDKDINDKIREIFSKVNSKSLIEKLDKSFLGLGKNSIYTILERKNKNGSLSKKDILSQLSRLEKDLSISEDNNQNTNTSNNNQNVDYNIRRVSLYNSIISATMNYLNKSYNDFYLADVESTYNIATPISTEYNLKCLYTLTNIDTIIEKYIRKNKYFDTKNIFDDTKTPDLFSEIWINDIDVRGNEQIEEAQKLDDYIAPKRFGVHSHYPIYLELPEEIKTLLKYQIATAGARRKINSKNVIDSKNVFSAIDYLLMIRDFQNMKDETKNSLFELVKHSDNFSLDRYLLDSIDEQGKEINYEIAYSTLIVARYVLEKYINVTNIDEIENQEYEKLELISTSESNKESYDSLSSYEKTILLKQFSKEEIKWLLESVQYSNYNSLKELMTYTIFFKNYINTEFSYDKDRYKNIISLFDVIKSTESIDKIESVISDWLRKINIRDLTDEEIIELDKIDPVFFKKTLSFEDRIIYNCCKRDGVPFKFSNTDHIIDFRREYSKFSPYTRFSTKKDGLHINSFTSLNRNITNYTKNINILNQNGINTYPQILPFLNMEENYLIRRINFLKMYGIENKVYEIAYYTIPERNLYRAIELYKLAGKNLFLIPHEFLIMKNFDENLDKLMTKLKLEKNSIPIYDTKDLAELMEKKYMNYKKVFNYTEIYGMDNVQKVWINNLGLNKKEFENYYLYQSTDNMEYVVGRHIYSFKEYLLNYDKILKIKESNIPNKFKINFLNEKTIKETGITNLKEYFEQNGMDLYELLSFAGIKCNDETSEYDIARFVERPGVIQTYEILRDATVPTDTCLNTFDDAVIANNLYTDFFADEEDNNYYLNCEKKVKVDLLSNFTGKKIEYLKRNNIKTLELIYFDIKVLNTQKDFIERLITSMKEIGEVTTKENVLKFYDVYNKMLSPQNNNSNENKAVMI